MASKPLLSVGLIVKNETRTIERCLSSFAPLKEKISCEIVVADTGSTDGTREIAERYADVLFDFPWIDDFSAARNAVMERSQGKWFLSIDADEWMEDFNELVAFLKRTTELGANLVIRNYLSLDPSVGYDDFTAMRLLRMSTGVRYTGRVHEGWVLGKPCPVLKRTVIHHDGYARELTEKWAARTNRNMPLLEAELEADPYNLRRFVQCIESGRNEDEKLTYVKRGLEVLKSGQMKQDSRFWGASLYRHAINVASTLHDRSLLDEWVNEAEAQFGDSVIIRMDGYALALDGYYYLGDMETAIQYGYRWLEGAKDYDNKRFNPEEIAVGAMITSTAAARASRLNILSKCLMNVERWDEASKIFKEIDPKLLLEGNWNVYTQDLLTNVTRLTSAPQCFQRLWEETAQLGAQGKQGWRERLQLLWKVLNDVVAAVKVEGGNTATDYLDLFSSIQDDLGRSARICMTYDVTEIQRELSEIEDWGLVLYVAYPHIMLSGADFPDSFYHNTPEFFSNVIGKFYKSSPRFTQAVLSAYRIKADFSFPRLMWLQTLSIVALQAEQWNQPEDGIELCDMFSDIFRQYLDAVYTPSILTEENIGILQGMHRFGWHYLQARDALASGEATEYLRRLKLALENAPAMKGMVSFLTEQLERREAEKRKAEIAQASPELMTLAEQVRGILAAYPADDPAVQALKQSPAYQKVAFLIEEPASQFTM